MFAEVNTAAPLHLLPCPSIVEPFKLMHNCVNCSSSLGILKVNGHGCMSHFCRASKYIKGFGLVRIRRVKSKKQQIICCVAYVVVQFCGLSVLVPGGTAGLVVVRLT